MAEVVTGFIWLWIGRSVVSYHGYNNGNLGSIKEQTFTVRATIIFSRKIILFGDGF
jgi:hypothetical protein